MAIKGLKKLEVSAWTGRNTAQNLTDGDPSTLLTAKNMLVLSDNQLRRMPGYALFLALGYGPVLSMFDFQRSVDGAQFWMAHVGDKIVAIDPHAKKVTVLSSGESGVPFQFVASSFVCYGANGVNAYRFVDVAGTLTKYNWGIAKPVTAPTIATSAGTLTLTYGRRYVVSYVSRYTDSLGIERISVGAPSDYTAFSGPITAGQVNLGSIEASTDPQVNYKWIFATTDSPIDTSSTYEFAAEITNATTTWTDTLLDTQLDDTQLAPFDNNPAPPSTYLTTWQNRIVAMQGSQIRLSGYAEILLGIPQEAWPLDLFFNVPGGSRKISGGIVNDSGQLLVGTTDFWYQYTGYDASTFTENDQIAQPGPAGPLAMCKTPFGIVWMSLSKKLWLSALTQTTVPRPPSELSYNLSQPLNGAVSMESIFDASQVRLHWYSYGRQQFLVAQCQTGNNASDWFQIWSVDTSKANMALYETDKFPGDLMTGSANAKLNGIPTVLCGDDSGNIYQFPSGFEDNGVKYESQASTPWMNLGAKSRLYWVDMLFDAPADLDQFGNIAKTLKVYAAVADAPNPNVKQGDLTLLDLRPIPSPEGESIYTVRANLQVQGCNTGRFVRLWVEFPNLVSDDDVVLQRLKVWYAPKWDGKP